MTQSSAGDGLDNVPGGGASPDGLTAAEALRLLREVGPNALPETKPTPLWPRFLRQFQDPLTVLAPLVKRHD
jgi:magnesium-transporting ATPase (P-type)